MPMGRYGETKREHVSISQRNTIGNKYFPSVRILLAQSEYVCRLGMNTISTYMLL